MKTRKFLGCAAAFSTALSASAQVPDWSTGGNNITTGEWFGADGSSTIPLEIRHDADQPIRIYTDARWRLWMNETATYGTLGAFSSIPAPGFTLLSPSASNFRSNGAPGPYTLLHLAAEDDNAQQLSYRPWMSTGITFTGNADHGYIGQKSRDLDYTDMIVHWSDNPGDWLKDRLRFLFTSGFNSAASGAESEEGLEFMRMWPNRYEDPHIGVGDFYAANLADPSITEPTERLDMVNGRLRIRELPEASGEATGTYKVMVVDDAAYPSDERGVVKWATLPVNPPVADCDWELVPVSNLMRTALDPVGTNGICPEADWTVGIGVGLPDYKLDVKHDEVAYESALTGAIRSVYVAEDLSQATSIRAEVAPESGGILGGTSYGLDARVFDAGAIGTGASGTVYVKTIDSYADRMSGIFGDVHGPSDAGGYLFEGYGVEGHISGEFQNGEIQFATGVAGEIEVNAQMNYCYGVSSWVHGSSPSVERIGFDGYIRGDDAAVTCHGARLDVTGATSTNHGVYAVVQGDAVTNFGVRAMTPSTGATFNFAVHGTAPIQTDSWAVWSEGNQFSSTSASWTTSDAALKQNIEEYSGGLASVLQLQPKTYQYQTDTYSYMNLPEGNQVGLIAQDVEQVLPDLVMQATRPAEFDSAGVETAPETSFKVMQYGTLIPILVSAVQELSAQLAIVQEQLAATQEQLASCCATNDEGSRSAPVTGSALGSSSTLNLEEQLTPAQERLLRIAPNPFTDRTTLYYTVERAGRAQLLVNSSDGRELIVLHEGQREAGEYQQVWSTEHLAPGVYHITLLLDGEPLVKRAVKVGR